MTQTVRLTHGIHRPAGVLEDRDACFAALLTACPPHSVLAEQAAAGVHGLWMPEPTDAPVEVILRGPVPVPRARARSRRPEIRGRRRVLRDDEVEVIRGLPVTTAARTWVDLSERLSLPDLVAAGDSALRGSTTVAEIDAVLSRAGHRRGVTRAREARGLLDPRSRSRPESHLRVAVVTSGLPAPEVNVAVYNDDGEWLFEPDLSYEQVRLAIEYNGVEHADPDRMRRDMTREIDAVMRGNWRTVSFGPVEVFRRPDQIGLTVARLWSQQRRALGR